jgi:hypothetical protein
MSLLRVAVTVSVRSKNVIVPAKECTTGWTSKVVSKTANAVARMDDQSDMSIASRALRRCAADVASAPEQK